MTICGKGCGLNFKLLAEVKGKVHGPNCYEQESTKTFGSCNYLNLLETVNLFKYNLSLQISTVVMTANKEMHMIMNSLRLIITEKNTCRLLL